MISNRGDGNWKTKMERNQRKSLSPRGFLFCFYSIFLSAFYQLFTDELNKNCGFTESSNFFFFFFEGRGETAFCVLLLFFSFIFCFGLKFISLAQTCSSFLSSSVRFLGKGVVVRGKQNIIGWKQIAESKQIYTRFFLFVMPCCHFLWDSLLLI